MTDNGLRTACVKLHSFVLDKTQLENGAAPLFPAFGFRTKCNEFQYASGDLLGDLGGLLCHSRLVVGRHPKTTDDFLKLWHW